MKTLFKILSFLYDITAALFSYIFLSGIAFSLNKILISDGNVGIIGGADAPTLLFILQEGGTAVLFQILFIVSGMTAAISGTAISFKESCSNAMLTAATAFLGIAAVLLMLIPPQSYAISQYGTLGNFKSVPIALIFYTLTIAECIFVVKRKVGLK